MRQHLVGFCLTVLALIMTACATQEELRQTSRKGQEHADAVKSSLETKIEQLNRTQREAEKTLARLDQLIEEQKREQGQTRELAAKLNSDLRGIRELDLMKVEGRIERAKRDIEVLQSRVEDQVTSLQQNAQQWLATLDQKQTAKLDQQVTRVNQHLAKVDARLETLDKREAAASTRIQETLTTLGKKIDERLDAQDRRMEARIKKVDDEGRLATNHLTVHLTDVDKSLVQVSETVKTVGAKLSTQIEQQGASLTKLEEAGKHMDGQIRGLTPRVDQLKTSMGELTKVLHTLTEKSGELDRRLTEVAGQTEGKVGVLAVQGGDQAAKLDKLMKRVELDAQAVTGHLNTVTENVNVLAKSIEMVQGHLAKSIETLTGRIVEIQSARPASSAPIESTQSIQPNQSDQGGQPDQPESSQPVRSPEPPVPAPSGGGAKPSAPGPVSSESAYEQAYQEFAKNRYDHALVSFRQFLIQHPNSPFVPNAHFWIAECYVKKRNYQRSLESYDQVIRNYPKSAKASIALYRKALVLIELKDKTGAKSTLKRLIATYPKSEESKQARTKLAGMP
jgi:tol-pal system protein YbgF